MTAASRLRLAIVECDSHIQLVLANIHLHRWQGQLPHCRQRFDCCQEATIRSILTKLPAFDMLREPETIPEFVTPDDFAAIYAACEVARHPGDRMYPPATWWRALMTLGIMSGMRLNEMLDLRWDDVHLDDGYLTVWADSTKANRTDRVPLHPVAVEHLRRITDYGPTVFGWKLCSTALYDEWHRIQEEAGIDLPCRGKHEHTDSCHRYDFHDLKRACGTLNASRMSRASLNKVMRHKSFATTDKHYLNAQKIAETATDSMFVPECLQ